MFYKNIDGVILNSIGQDKISLILDTEKYPKAFDQVGIINFIELDKKEPEEIKYSVDNGCTYLSAFEFRQQHGYDVCNQFFK